MSIKLAMIGAALIALEAINSSPAIAALLEFDFTTESGGIGSFNLDTDTIPDPEPAVLFAADGSTIAQGFQYLFALSDFSFSLPNLDTLNFPDGDIAIFPTIPVGSSNSGVLSFAGAPARLDPDEFPIVQFDFGYFGNLEALPALSVDPSAYANFGNILVFESTEFTAELIAADEITDVNVQVSSPQSVPESNSTLGVLAIGFGGAGSLLKQKFMSANKS